MKRNTHIELITKVLLIITLIGFTQCKKESKLDNLSIVGKWQLVSGNYKRYNNKIVTQTGIVDVQTEGYTIVFNNDGTAVATDNSGAVEEYNYKLSGNTIKLSAFGTSYVPFILTPNTLEWTYWVQGTIDNGVVTTETLNKIK
jgi:hypothetical protein